MLFALACADDARAEKRVALVIGNSAYQHTGKLANPRKDATDISAALKKHGFQVLEGYDLDKVSFDRKVREFAAALKGAEVGLFFYAGHGLQLAGQNYLVPIDAKAEGAETLDFEMVRVEVVHRAMERQTSTNILFLDACRDNPLARNLARSMGTRSTEVGRGLAAIESGIGSLISFSTQPGNYALDGSGRNSPFAGALVKQLTAATDDLSTILVSVRNDVMKETQRKQVPWEHSALTGRFFFSSAPQASIARQGDTTAGTGNAGRTSAFDGAWLVTVLCSPTSDGTRGYTTQIVAKVENGVLRGNLGAKHTPGWLGLSGAIEPDGTALIAAEGLSGNAAVTVGGLAPGTYYSYIISAKLSGKLGVGKRDASRACDVTFAKR